MAVFLDFFRNSTFKRAEVFCVSFSAPGPFFCGIKIPTIFQISYHEGGTPRQNLQAQFPKVQNLKKKNFWNHKGKPHTMTHGRDHLSVFCRKFNRPTGATISFVINSFSVSSLVKISSKHHLSQTVRARDTTFLENVEPTPPTHVSYVTCHILPFLFLFRTKQ